jgi:hypothetical protein
MCRTLNQDNIGAVREAVPMLTNLLQNSVSEGGPCNTQAVLSQQQQWDSVCQASIHQLAASHSVLSNFH